MPEEKTFLVDVTLRVKAEDIDHAADKVCNRVRSLENYTTNDLELLHVDEPTEIDG